MLLYLCSVLRSVMQSSLFVLVMASPFYASFITMSLLVDRSLRVVRWFIGRLDLV